MTYFLILETLAFVLYASLKCRGLQSLSSAYERLKPHGRLFQIWAGLTGLLIWLAPLADGYVQWYNIPLGIAGLGLWIVGAAPQFYHDRIGPLHYAGALIAAAGALWHIWLVAPSVVVLAAVVSPLAFTSDKRVIYWLEIIAIAALLLVLNNANNLTITTI